MHITRRSGTSYNAIVTVSSPLIRSGLISALRYDQKYSFLTTYHHGKVPEKMGNGESCRFVEITYVQLKLKDYDAMHDNIHGPFTQLTAVVYEPQQSQKCANVR